MTRVSELTEQQKKCLRFVYEGLTSKQIAPILETTPGVVDNYINAALSKLAITSRREAARILIAHEKDMVQQLHLQSETLAETIEAPDQQGRVGVEDLSLVSLFNLPPVGGEENDLPISQRILALSRIGLFAALAVLGATVIIRGVITLLR